VPLPTGLCAVLCGHVLVLQQDLLPINRDGSEEKLYLNSPFKNINFLLILFYRKSRDSSVGIATGYGLDDQGVGVWVPVGTRIFTSLCSPDRLWGPPKPPIQWVTWASFREGKASGT
jgi:hypothetical protein